MFWALFNSPNLHLSEQISNVWMAITVCRLQVTLLFLKVSGGTGTLRGVFACPTVWAPVTAGTKCHTLSGFRMTQIPYLTVL